MANYEPIEGLNLAETPDAPGTPATPGTTGTTPLTPGTPAVSTPAMGVAVPYVTLPKPDSIPFRDDGLNLDSNRGEPQVPLVPRKQNSTPTLEIQQTQMDLSVTKKSSMAKPSNTVVEKKGILKQIHPIAYVFGVLAVALMGVTCLFAAWSVPN